MAIFDFFHKKKTPEETIPDLGLEKDETGLPASRMTEERAAINDFKPAFPTEPAQPTADFQLLNTKLDLINQRLENIDRRLQTIEQLAKEEK